MLSKKYPRSLHLPFSPGASSDDKIMSAEQFQYFIGKEIVITEKLDGSNVCLTSEACFSRSHSGPPTHKSFDILKFRHATLKEKIIPNYSVFIEYTMALHSIKYYMLQDYLNLFGVRNDETGEWLSWDDVSLWSEILGIPHVPLILRGTFFDKDILQDTIEKFATLSSVYGPVREGLVIRTTEPPYVNELNQLIGLGKWVREGHVEEGSEHWERKPIVPQNCIGRQKFY